MRRGGDHRAARQSAQHGSARRARARALSALAAAALAGLSAAACGEKKTNDTATDASADARANTALDGSSGATDAAVADAGLASFPSQPAHPFGSMKTYDKSVCRALMGAGKHRVAERDLRSYFVDGDDPLALVNRAPTGVLPPDYTPSDLVDLRTQKPVASEKDCEKVQCLRKDAAAALADMMAAMAKQGFPGHIESAYRSYFAQCSTFLHWVEKAGGDFCDAAEQSALPGHSQHQLGTTVDLFTEEWKKDPRGVFREGFGCTDAGQWLQKHSWEYGFVMPYPIHPDDRHPQQKCVVRWDIPVPINPMTGYRFEHWHYRWVGKENAAAFKDFIAKSPEDAPDAPTLEQWLRKKRGLVADAELPVCDGCACGACETLADDGPCKDDALKLGDDGLPEKKALAANQAVRTDAPEITKVSFHNKKGTTIVDVTVTVPDDVLTQPPVTTAKHAIYTDGADVSKLVPYPGTAPHRYDALPSAWRIGVRAVGAPAFAFQASLASPKLAPIYNRANVFLPATPGTHAHSIVVPKIDGAVEVALLVDGKVVSAKTIDDK
jgi:D-alanyl-D-alanine carboxypeptidase